MKSNRRASRLTLPASLLLTGGSLLVGGMSCGQPKPANGADTSVQRATENAAQATAATGSMSTQLAGIMPRGLTSVGAATLGDALYLVGGYHGSPHDYSMEGQSGAMRRMNLSDGSWQELPGVKPLQSPAVVAHGKYIYKLGGLRNLNTHDEPTDMRSIADAARFDTTSNQWQALPPLPEGRSSAYAVVFADTLYVIGGWKLEGGMYDSTWSETLLTADLSKPTFAWQSQPMPFQIRAQGLAVLGDKIYVLGGIAPEGSTDAAHIYDPKTKTWSDGPTLPFDNMTTRAAVYQGKLYANGADASIYCLTNDAAYDKALSETRWKRVGSVRFGRLFHEMVASNQGPLVLAGIPNNSRGGRVRMIERLSLEPAPAGLVMSFSGGTAAKNRQGVFLWSQQLFTVGGNTSLGQHDFAQDNFTSATARLDLGALAWRPVKDFPAARQSMQALVVGKDETSALIFGGFGFSGNKLATHADVFRHDFRERSWVTESKLRLPEGRSQFGIAEWQEAVWMFGGMNFDPQREQEKQILHTAQILKLDQTQSDGHFEDAGVSLAQPRRAFAGTQLDGKYYVVGGMGDEFAMVQGCEVVDLDAKTSHAMPCPPEHRLGAELVALSGKLFLVGGSVAVGDKRKSTNRIEAFDPKSQSWLTVTASVPFETTEQMRAFAYQDQLLLFSSHQAKPGVQVALLDPQALLTGRQDFQRVEVASPIE